MWLQDVEVEIYDGSWKCWRKTLTQKQCCTSTRWGPLTTISVDLSLVENPFTTMVFHPVCWGYNYFTTRGAPSSRVLISYFLFLIGLPERVLVLGHHFFFVDFLDEEVGDSSGHQSRKVHPRRTNGGIPKIMDPGKRDPLFEFDNFWYRC